MTTAPPVRVFVAFQNGKGGAMVHASAPVCAHLQGTIGELSVAICTKHLSTLWPHYCPNDILQDRFHMFFVALYDGEVTTEVPLQSSAYVWEVADVASGGFSLYVVVHVQEGVVSSQCKRILKVIFCCQNRVHLRVKNTFLEARYGDVDCSANSALTPALDIEINFTCFNRSKSIVDSASARNAVEIGATPHLAVDAPQTSHHSDAQLQSCGDEQSFIQAIRAGNNEFLITHLSGCSGDRNMYQGCKELVGLFFFAILKGACTHVIHHMATMLPNIKTLRDKNGNSAMHVWARATTGGDSLAETGKLLINLRADVNAQRCQDGMTPLHHLAASYARRHNRRDQHKIVLLCRFGAHTGMESTSGMIPLDFLHCQSQRDRFVDCSAQSFSTCPVCWTRCVWING